MPNWCTTRLHFYGEETIVVDFYEKLTGWFNAKESIYEYKNNFGIQWLGNILAYTFGKAFVKEHEHDTDLNFRGWIQDIDTFAEYNAEKKVWLFTATMESAWCPHMRMWYLILEKLYGKDADIHISYISDEPNMGSYFIHDPDHIIYKSENIYHVEAWDMNDRFGLEECDCEYEKKDLIEVLKDFFDIECTEDMLDDTDKLNEMIQEVIKESGQPKGDCGFYVCKYRIAKKEDY